jgi:hypothetical protein
MLRAEREKLTADERGAVAGLLAGTGCENLFASGR